MTFQEWDQELESMGVLNASSRQFILYECKLHSTRERDEELIRKSLLQMAKPFITPAGKQKQLTQACKQAKQRALKLKEEHSALRKPKLFKFFRAHLLQLVEAQGFLNKAVEIQALEKVGIKD